MQVALHTHQSKNLSLQVVPGVLLWQLDTSLLAHQLLLLQPLLLGLIVTQNSMGADSSSAELLHCSS
jgi:hypothetical protein